jgi:arylsulfatase A
MVMKRWQALYLKIGMLLLAGCVMLSCAAPKQPPNFIFMLIDDMGWTDVGTFGSTFYETPNVDRLADEGMRFTNAYAACTVCSPTRAAVLTGKYPARLHITDWIEGHKRPWAQLAVPDWTMYLPHEEITIAEALKPTGYATVHIGKWHLGKEPFYPETQGFDRNIAGNDMGSPPSYYHPYERGNRTIATMPPGGQDGDYLTDRLTDEAVTWIEDHQAEPFFMYFPHYAVHTPIQSKKELEEYYAGKVNPDNPQRNAAYAGMVHSTDESVGRIMETLERLDLEDNTVLVFFSDNGGLIGNNFDKPITSNVPLREGKGTEYEGGVRVPCIVKWPGNTEPGSTSDVPVIATDFYKTLLDMAGVQPQANTGVDGLSLTPLLTQTGTLDRDALYWHYPHYHSQGARPYSAIRKGDYRLIEYFEDGRMEMYNLANDIGETNNLIDAMPEKAHELHAQLQAWRDEVGAQYPTKNPNFDPARETERAAR